MDSPSLSSIPCYQDCLLCLLCVSRYQGMAGRGTLYMCGFETNKASFLTRRTFLNHFQIDASQPMS